MAVSSSAVIVIAVAGAFVVLGTVSAIHKIYKGPQTNMNGDPTAWNPYRRNAEQQARLTEVRQIHNAQAWSRARTAREEIGLPIPDWYPGSEWVFSQEASLIRRSRVLDMEAEHKDHRFVGNHNLTNPARVGQVYDRASRMFLQDESNDAEEDEYGLPMRQQETPMNFSRRFSQRLSNMISFRAVTTPEPESRKMDNLGGRPVSTLYLRDDGFIAAPPAAFVRQTGQGVHQGPGVHQMVAQWEAINGRY